MNVSQQLPLPFEHRVTYEPVEFLPDTCNAAALAWLNSPWPGNRLAVWGGAGCGKTHLLHLWSDRTNAEWFCGRDLEDLPELPPSGGIAVDDADAAPEEPLLHLLNAASEAGLPVLLTARSAPARWRTVLADLSSRLRAITAVELERPGERMLRAMFASQLTARQLAVPEPLQDWLLLRLPREPAVLRDVAARLDRAALAAGRRITMAIAAQVIAEAT